MSIITLSKQLRFCILPKRQTNRRLDTALSSCRGGQFFAFRLLVPEAHRDGKAGRVVYPRSTRRVALLWRLANEASRKGGRGPRAFQFEATSGRLHSISAGCGVRVAPDSCSASVCEAGRAGQGQHALNWGKQIFGACPIQRSRRGLGLEIGALETLRSRTVACGYFGIEDLSRLVSTVGVGARVVSASVLFAFIHRSCGPSRCCLVREGVHHAGCPQFLVCLSGEYNGGFPCSQFFFIQGLADVPSVDVVLYVNPTGLPRRQAIQTTTDSVYRRTTKRT